MAGTLFKTDILNTPRALRSTLEALGSRPDEVVAALLTGGARRVVALGNGSSWYASAASVALYNALAGPGGTVAMAAPTGDFALYPAPLAESDALVGVSASGEIVDLLDLFDRLHSRHHLVGITNVGTSSLTRLVDHSLVMNAGPSLVPTATKTFTTSILALDLLWLSLLARQGVARAKGLRQAIEAIPEAAEKATAEGLAQVDAWAERVSGRSRLFIFGAGPAYPLAQEVALVFQEVAGIPSQAVQTREMMHGTTSVIDSTSGVIAIIPPGPGESVGRKTMAECAPLAGVAINVGASPAEIAITAECDDLLAPLVYGAPLFLLANEVAIRRGGNPDQPDWYAGYMRASRRGSEE